MDVIIQHVSYKERLYTARSVTAIVPVIKHEQFAENTAKINLRLR